MFRGIVQTVGKIESIKDKNHIKTIRIETHGDYLEDIAIGQSVSVDGVCLSLVKKNNEFEFSWYVNEDSEKIIKSCDIISNKHSFYSHVSREDAQQLMVNSAHCLLSIGNKNPNQIPSKVNEYLATGKPIIHFTEIDDDPVINLSN